LAEWEEVLADQLMIMKNVARYKCLHVAEARKLSQDAKAIHRSLQVGDLAWVRSSGLDGKLEAAWLEPYEVLQKIGPVDYRLNLGKNRKSVARY